MIVHSAESPGCPARCPDAPLLGLRKGVDQDKSFREAVRRARVRLLCSEVGGPITGDDTMAWITAVLLAGMVLAGVTVHAMTGGAS
jgi:hypothetical protein